ncbi:hypothetical protein ACFQO7_05130 [Catellatospora aurea]|uniref:Uncharacterized protein n=2 Tax=Catellatospora TaxID=53365 RepID=A0ABW2GPA0_9ACTN
MTHKRWFVRLRARNGGAGLWWGLVVVLFMGLVVEAVRELSRGDQPSHLPVVDDWLSAGLILVSSVMCA